MRNKLSMLITGLVLVGLLAACAPAPAKVTFPTKTITWIVPASPGGGLDTLARGIGSAMSQYLPGEAGGVVIKNVSQPMGFRGLEVLAQSQPDGYTILINTVDGSLLNELQQKPSWKFTDFTFIGQVYLSTFCASVLAKSPYKTVEDLAKSNSTLRWGVITGDSQHLMTVMLADEMGTKSGVKSAMVGGYTGTNAIPVAMMRGEIDIMLNTVAVTTPFVSSGDLRMLFTLTDDRLAKDVPTAKELGYSKEASTYSGVFVVLAPPGVPKDIIAILEDAVHKTVTDPDVQAWGNKVGYTLAWASAADATQVVKDRAGLMAKYYPMLATSTTK